MSDPFSEQRARDADAEDAAAHAVYDEIYQVMRANGELPGDGDADGLHSLNEPSLELADIDPSMNVFASTSNDLPPSTSHAAVDDRQPSIPIPASLAGIASQVKPLELDFEEPALLTFDVIQDRGEMGGKRKKALSERAGWKDMDEHGNMPKRPRGKRGAAASRDITSDDFLGYSSQDVDAQLRGSGSGVLIAESNEPGGSQTPGVGGGDGGEKQAVEDIASGTEKEIPLESEVLADVLRQSAAGLHSPGPGLEQDSSAIPGEGPPHKRDYALPNESRAEQNRRAQQVYRRRREERIKELEAQAAALEPTRRALTDSHAKLRNLAQDYEASQIQLTALQNTLRNLNKQGVSILTTQYNFPMDTDNLKETESMRAGPIAEGDVDKAFEQLERQSKALVASRKAT